MCGIVGLLADSMEIKRDILSSLKVMEYRGYDSAGLAVINEAHCYLRKEVGKLKNLDLICKDYEPSGLGVGIGHIRWATHGGVSKRNAHPLKGEHSFLVHNGIIENHLELKNLLQNEGIKFASDTDSEVIVHLFEFNLRKLKDVSASFKQTVGMLTGSFALLLISTLFKDKIFFAKHRSPLVIGQGAGKVQLVSSVDAFNSDINEICFLNDGDMGYVSLDKMVIFNNNKVIIPSFETFFGVGTQSSVKKGEYFMEKEIYEQHKVLQNTIKNRIINDRIVFQELPKDFFKNKSRIVFCACGTSYHAALIGSYLFEQYAKLETSVQIASEFRYKNPVLNKNDTVVLISQSGETADVLACFEYCKQHKIDTLVIANVAHSSLVRGSIALLSKVGTEKGVASTKSFTAQVLLLWMLALYAAEYRDFIDKDLLKQQIIDIKNAIKVTKERKNEITLLVEKCFGAKKFFFIGRNVFYPLALEGALKLKEITYISAEGYPAGEMKHGPIALADDTLYTIALLPLNLLYDKTKSNIMEIASRNSKIINISQKELGGEFGFIKLLNSTSYMVELFESMVILQLFAFLMSVNLNLDADMPRNLAKSVTVE